MHYHPNGQPKHVRAVRADATPEARCTGMGSFPDPGHSFCPRHHPDEYAEYMARHSVDSISPAEYFHTFGITR